MANFNFDKIISCKEYACIKKEEYKNAQNKLCLSIIQVGDNPASNSYVRGKLKDCDEVGIKTYLYKLPDYVMQVEFSQAINKAMLNGGGIVIQQPYPKKLHVSKYEMASFQDVDGMFYDNYKPCTPEGIIDWLDFNKIELRGTDVCVLGRGQLVGKPLAQMLLDRDATVTICHSKSNLQSVRATIVNADIVISATGVPQDHWYVPASDYGKKIFIDVGIFKDENGKLRGDLDREYLEHQGHYCTPVPGGVGLLTRVTLLKHLVEPCCYYEN